MKFRKSSIILNEKDLKSLKECKGKVFKFPKRFFTYNLHTLELTKRTKKLISPKF